MCRLWKQRSRGKKRNAGNLRSNKGQIYTVTRNNGDCVIEIHLKSLYKEEKIVNGKRRRSGFTSGETKSGVPCITQMFSPSNLGRWTSFKCSPTWAELSLVNRQSSVGRQKTFQLMFWKRQKVRKLCIFGMFLDAFSQQLTYSNR